MPFWCLLQVWKCSVPNVKCPVKWRARVCRVALVRPTVLTCMWRAQPLTTPLTTLQPLISARLRLRHPTLRRHLPGRRNAPRVPVSTGRAQWTMGTGEGRGEKEVRKVWGWCRQKFRCWWREAVWEAKVLEVEEGRGSIHGPTAGVKTKDGECCQKEVGSVGEALAGPTDTNTAPLITSRGSTALPITDRPGGQSHPHLPLGRPATGACTAGEAGCWSRTRRKLATTRWRWSLYSPETQPPTSPMGTGRRGTVTERGVHTPYSDRGIRTEMGGREGKGKREGKGERTQRTSWTDRGRSWTHGLCAGTSPSPPLWNPPPSHRCSRTTASHRAKAIR